MNVAKSFTAQMPNIWGRMFLLNTTIMPNEGVFSSRKVSLEEAKNLFSKRSDNHTGFHENHTSAVGHEAAAEAFNILLGFTSGEIVGDKITVNRQAIEMAPGDQAIALKMNGRIEEGKILTLNEMDKIGYELYFIECWDVHSGKIYTPAEMAQAYNEGLHNGQDIGATYGMAGMNCLKTEMDFL